MDDGNYQLKLKVAAQRGGTVKEISSFLSDFEKAYISLYQFNSFRDEYKRFRKFPIEILIDAGYFPDFLNQSSTFSEVPPDDLLFVNRVLIQSPGFWEFLGSLNPLQQIREYLNDRHKRRQDREYREEAEKTKLVLENELIKRQIYEKENSILSERIKILRELGWSNKDIDKLIWNSIGIPLSRLGQHQDKGLIGGTLDDKKDLKS